MTDLQLMEALRTGEQEAMRILVDRFSRRLFKYLYGWVRNREDAMDLTQDVLMRVYQKAHLFKRDAHLTPWVFRIARNMFHDYLRRKNFRVHSTGIPLEDAGSAQLTSDWTDSDPERAIRRKETARKVQDAIQRLPQRQREVLQLRLLGEMRLEEIGQALNLSLGGVKSTLHNALSRLRSELSDLEGEAHV